MSYVHESSSSWKHLAIEGVDRVRAISLECHGSCEKCRDLTFGMTLKARVIASKGGRERRACSIWVRRQYIMTTESFRMQAARTGSRAMAAEAEMMFSLARPLSSSPLSDMWAEAEGVCKTSTHTR